jgi:la-related protein 1
MDVEGYVPVAFVGSFHAVYSLHQDYASLLEAMKQSEVIMDGKNGFGQMLRADMVFQSI